MKHRDKWNGWPLEHWVLWYGPWLKEGFDKLGAKSREWDQADFEKGGD